MELTRTSCWFQANSTLMFLTIRTNWDHIFSKSAYLPAYCNTCTTDVTFVNRGKFGSVIPASSTIRSSVNRGSRYRTSEGLFLFYPSAAPIVVSEGLAFKVQNSPPRFLKTQPLIPGKIASPWKWRKPQNGRRFRTRHVSGKSGSKNGWVN